MSRNNFIQRHHADGERANETTHQDEEFIHDIFDNKCISGINSKHTLLQNKNKYLKIVCGKNSRPLSNLY